MLATGRRGAEEGWQTRNVSEANSTLAADRWKLLVVVLWRPAEDVGGQHCQGRALVESPRSGPQQRAWVKGLLPLGRWKRCDSNEAGALRGLGCLLQRPACQGSVVPAAAAAAAYQGSVEAPCCLPGLRWRCAERCRG